MRRALVVMLTFVLVAGSAAAQKDCGDGLPCGKLLWDLPILPTLASPTPMPTIQITSIPPVTPGSTPAPTNTAVPTGTIMADFSGVADQMQTLSAVVAATPMPILVSGTPMAAATQYAQLVSDSGQFFNYMRGFQEANFGGWSPFITLAIVALLLTVTMKGAAFILPVVAVLFRLILRIVEVVKKLIGL